jgi:hypothetical protein
MRICDDIGTAIRDNQEVDAFRSARAIAQAYGSTGRVDAVLAAGSVGRG